MAEPSLSIIVPLYNKEQYVAEALESIINQTIREIEIICVDDGSTDQSGSIVEEYAKSDPRIKVLHKEHEGLVSARKAGILQAKAQYIGFVDADDWIEPNMFQRLYDEMILKQLDFVSSGIIEQENLTRMDVVEEKIYANEEGREELFATLIWDHKAGCQGIVPNTVTKLYKRDILMESCKNIDNRIHLHEDDSLVYSYIIRCKTIGILHEAYYHHRLVDNSDSQMVDEFFFARQNYFYVFLKHEFKKSKYCEVLMPQLDFYVASTMIYGLNYMAGLTLDACIDANYIFLGKKRIVVYGAGKHGQKIIEKILHSKNHELIAIADRNLSLKEIKGYPIKNIESIVEMEFDVLIIAITNTYIQEEVRNKFIDMGVSPEKLIVF